jgi:hypothetical protein
MAGLGLYGQILRVFKLQAPHQVQRVHFPFLGFEHPDRGCWTPGCDCRLCRFSRGPGLIRRARHTGFHLVVRCAIDISSPNELNWFILPLSQAHLILHNGPGLSQFR